MGHLYEVLTSPSLPVVLCNFMRARGHVGIMKTMGIYLQDMNSDLRTTSTDIGIALGLLNALSNFPAPIIAALYRHQSIRRLLFICGACLPAIGVALASMATSNTQIAIFLSVSGLGNCILMICCTLTLHQLATENYNLLFSVSLTSFGVGMVLLPIVAEVLRQAYGWRGGLLIIGALMANTIPGAMATRLGSDERGRQRNGFQSVPSFPSESSPSEECQSGVTHSNITGGNNEETGFFWRITAIFRQSDFYLDPVFSVVFGFTFAFYMVYSGWHSFLVPHALQRGISIENTIIMTFSAAIGNTFSRAAVGVLTNNLVKPTTLYLLATILNITALFCDVFFSKYYVMLVTSCLSAMSIGGRAVLEPLVVRERASPTKFDVAYATSKVFTGFGQFLGGFLSGMIADRFLSYDATFKLLAGFDILVLLLITLVIFRPKPTPT